MLTRPVSVSATGDTAVHQLLGRRADSYIGTPNPTADRSPMQPNEEVQSQEVQNPFALMTSPEAVFAALERSDRLARLKSTICRPLDKPRPEKPIVELRAFDEAIESIEVVDDSFGDQSGERV